MDAHSGARNRDERGLGRRADVHGTGDAGDAGDAGDGGAARAHLWVRAWEDALERAMTSPAFRSLLLRDPAAALAEHGLPAELLPQVREIAAHTIEGHVRAMLRVLASASCRSDYHRAE